jgi:hypothetical protein
MTHLISRLGLLFSASLLVLALSGCGTTRRIDSQVQSVHANVVGAAPLPGARYRFERLPSQINNPAAGLAEQQAQAALAAVGLVRDDALAQLSIQVNARATSYIADPWGRPLLGVGMNGYWGHGVGMGFGMSSGMRFPPPTHYQYEVSIVLRDLRSAQVVYETQAVHNGPWADANQIFPVLMQAALQDFPNPPAASRQVNIDILR